MATVNKDFKIKYGLVVEGASATVNGNQILTETASDTYILNLIGGETLVKSVSNEFDVSVAGELSIDRAVVDAYYDAAGSADAAEAAANLYTDGREIAITSAYQTYADQAETDAKAYTDTREIAITSAYEAYADQAELDAVATANAYTDTAVSNAIGDIPTSTDELAEGVTNLYYTDVRARGAVSDGDGLNYNSATGVFSAHLGNGLEIGLNGEIQIDDSVVVTETDLADAISDHNVASGVHGVTGNVVGTTDSQTISNKTLGGDLAAGGFQITNLGTPVNSTDAATKGYVDAVAEGLHVHASVAALADSNIVLPTTPATVDGVSLSVNDRVLLVGQTNPAENGIYVVINGDLARAADYNTASEIQAGDFVFVSGGTVYNSTGWVQENVVTTLGTDPIVWDQFSGAGAYTAGNGLTLNGTVFEINETITATRSYVDSEVDAHTALTSAHGVTGDIVGTSDTQTLTSKTLGFGTLLGANLDAANTYTISNLEEPVNAQDAATKAYVDGEISSVSAAVDNLTTTDVAEGTNLYFTDNRAKDAVAAALGDGIEYEAGSFNVQIATGLVLGGGTGNEIEIDRTTVDTWYDAAGTAQGIVDALDTDDIEEGSTNLYFTDGRAKTSAAELLTSATLTNITITGTGAGLTITAENGVADSTTDELDEGTANLYFTDARAVSALEAVVPDFEAVEINSIAKEVATTATVATAGTATVLTWDTTVHRTVKAIVKFATADHTEVSEVLLTLDGLNNVAITEYAEVGTNGAMGTVTATVVSGEGRINVTTLNNATVVLVRATLLA